MKRTIVPAFLKSRAGIVGLVLFLTPLCVAVFGPMFNLNSPVQSVGLPGALPSADHVLGLDYLGRDVLARTLAGGVTIFTLGVAASVIAYVCGFFVGVTAGYGYIWLESILMRIVDLILAFPAIVVLLIAITVLGTNPLVMLGSVAIIQLPGIARLVRTTTQVARRSGYVESAVARGESPFRVIANEIVPNIAPIILVDFGLRFGQSVLLVASMNFLGLGLQPPAADWGLMIAENRAIVVVNPFSTLVPAGLLLILMIGINLLGDAFSATRGSSRAAPRKRRPHRRVATTLQAQTRLTPK